MRCPTCGGRGATGAPWDPDTCMTCRGSGKVADKWVLTERGETVYAWARALAVAAYLAVGFLLLLGFAGWIETNL